MLVAGGDVVVRIGARVDIGSAAALATGSYEMDWVSDRATGAGYNTSIMIGNGGWFNACSSILGATDISECAVVAAGALVNRDVASWLVVGGVPVKVLRDASGKASS